MSLVKSIGYIRSTKSNRLELLSLFLFSELVSKLYYILFLFLVLWVQYLGLGKQDRRSLIKTI
jgi:hypothetical protein